MAVDLANETSRRGHRVTMCVTRSTVSLATELAPEIQSITLGRRWRYDVLPVARLVRYIRTTAVDLVHVHMRSSLSLVLPLRATRLIPTPLVFHDHYGSIEEDTSVPRWFRIGARMIDAYVGVSDSLGMWARTAGVPRERIHVIENAVDLARLSDGPPSSIVHELGLAQDTQLVLLVATVRKDKAIETAIEAVARSRYAQRLHLVIAGAIAEPDYAKSLRDNAVKLGLGDHVTFLGARRDVPALLRACDLAVLSSNTESGPLVLIEYLSAGKLIVSTRVGDVGRRLANAGLPGFVPPRNPDAMARAIDEALELDDAGRRRRESVGRALLDRFDIRDAFPRWAEVYESVRMPR